MIDSAEEFVRLRTSDEEAEYKRASREEAPDAVWRAVIDSYPDMRVWVVANKTIPLSFLEELSASEDVPVRDAVARKRRATPEILARLAKDSDSGVRYAVACNKSTPDDVLRSMLDDDWDEVVSKAGERLGVT